MGQPGWLGRSLSVDGNEGNEEKVICVKGNFKENYGRFEKNTFYVIIFPWQRYFL